MADLVEIFKQTLHPQREIIQAAEAQLKGLSAQPGFTVQVLQVVAAPGLDEAVRQAAAVNFKNTVKYRWSPSDTDAYSGVTALPDAEKAQLKAQLPSLMLATPPRIQAQLSEALSLICSHDFPKNWPTLLPELVTRLDNADLNTIQGVLVTANSIFKRYRNQYRSDAMVAELATSQEVFAPTLLETQKKLAAQFAVTQDPATLKTLLSCVRLSFRIFFSFNAPGVTPLMESQLDTWMDNFHKFLTMPDNPALAERDEDKESITDAVRSAVCHNINLYMEQNEDDFVKYLKTFVTAVWELLLKVSDKPGQDNLAMSAIRFLTTISKSCHFQLFGEPGALQQICQSIVVPNLRVRADDEEVFEMNPLEYIRRDSEGSDSDTRRRAAADLVKSLVEKYPAEVTGLCTQYIQAMLAEYAAAPTNNWKAKDCAIYLVLALTVKGKTASRGATSTNNLVNIQDFFASQVLPELQNPRLDAVPILKADAIKFVITFRSLLPKESLVQVVPCLVQLLACEACVVHSYAATAIEKMMAIKDDGVSRFSSSDFSAVLSQLLTNLFAAFKHPDSAENEYIMRAVTRVIGFVGSGIAPVAPAALTELARMLMEVCKNPRNPGFNHYLFEGVAALIKHAGAANASMIDTFEQLLFPAFNHVLQQDVQEFHPYVFQIFAQLIELRGAPIPAVYMQIFPPLLLPQFWERSGNVPALVRLLQAYLTKANSEVISGGHLMPMLGVFQKLIASKAHDHEGFYILCALVENAPLAAYEQHLPTIFQILFTRLQGSRTVKFARHFLNFLSTFILKHGPVLTSSTLDKVQPGIFFMLLQQVWLPNLSLLDANESKMAVVATTKCLAELQPLQANTALWTSLRDAAYKQIETSKNITGPIKGPEDDEADVEEAAGYSAAFAQLSNAARPARPVLAEIPDPRQFMESSLANIPIGR